MSPVAAPGYGFCAAAIRPESLAEAAWGVYLSRVVS